MIRKQVSPSIVLTMIGILVLAAGLQLIHLGDRSLWIDEIKALQIANEPSVSEVLDSHYKSDQRQLPLYLLMMNGWMRFAGESDFAVRLPSALLAVASVALLYWVGVMLSGHALGLVSAFLLAVSPFLLLFGRMARPWALTLALSLLATGLVIRLVQRGKEVSWPLLAGYVVTTVLALGTNYVNVALVGAQNAFILLWVLRNREHSRETHLFSRWLIGQLAILVLVGGALAYDWSRTSQFADIEAMRLSLQGWKGVILLTLYPLFAYGLGETIFPWNPIAILGLIGVGVALLVGIKRLPNLRTLAWLPVLSFSFVILLTVVSYITIVRTHPFETLPSRAIAALPFFILVLALGLLSMRPNLRFASLAVIVLSCSFSWWNYFAGEQIHQPTYLVPTKEIAELIMSKAQPADLVFGDEDLGLDYYYQERTPPLLFSTSKNAVSLAQRAKTRVWLATLGRDSTRVELSPHALESVLERRFKLVSSWNYLPQDPTYSRIKERIQGFSDYRYKATVRLFERT